MEVSKNWTIFIRKVRFLPFVCSAGLHIDIFAYNKNGKLCSDITSKSL